MSFILQLDAAIEKIRYFLRHPRGIAKIRVDFYIGVSCVIRFAQQAKLLHLLRLNGSSLGLVRFVFLSL